MLGRKTRSDWLEGLLEAWGAVGWGQQQEKPEVHTRVDRPGVNDRRVCPGDGGNEAGRLKSALENFWLTNSCCSCHGKLESTVLYWAAPSQPYQSSKTVASTG